MIYIYPWIHHFFRGLIANYFVGKKCSASEFRREYDGACLQMRMAYCPAAHFFLFLVQWTDCSLAGALGLLRILIYKVDQHFCLRIKFLHIFYAKLVLTFKFKNILNIQVYADGTTTMSTHERKASIREFYGIVRVFQNLLNSICFAPLLSL